MKYALSSLRMLLLMTFLTGALYPLVITAFARLSFPWRAQGSLIQVAGVTMGSHWIGQNFSQEKYFWPRPSASNYDPLPSSGSNLGPTSEDLKKAVLARETKLKGLDSGQGDPPQDLLFASASGLDPDISPEAAFYQVKRVALARGFGPKRTDRLKAMIKKHIQKRQFGILGEPRVNVLELNLALDHM